MSQLHESSTSLATGERGSRTPKGTAAADRFGQSLVVASDARHRRELEGLLVDWGARTVDGATTIPAAARLASTRAYGVVILGPAFDAMSLQAFFGHIRACAPGTLLFQAASGPTLFVAAAGDLDGIIWLTAAGPASFFATAEGPPGAFAAASGPESRIALSRKETDLLRALGRGATVRAAADVLAVSEGTAKTYTKSLYRKLGIASRAAAVAEARRRGLA